MMARFMASVDELTPNKGNFCMFVFEFPTPRKLENEVASPADWGDKMSRSSTPPRTVVRSFHVQVTGPAIPAAITKPLATR